MSSVGYYSSCSRAAKIKKVIEIRNPERSQTQANRNDQSIKHIRILEARPIKLLLFLNFIFNSISQNMPIEMVFIKFVSKKMFFSKKASRRVF